MPSIDRTITVSTPQAKVWEFMSDFRSTEQWDPPTERTVRESGDGGVGTVYKNTSTLMGMSVDITYTVIEFEPPRMIRLKGETSSMTAIDTIEVTEVPDGTELRYRADFTLSGASKVLEPLLPVGLKKLGDEAEKQLRECLEAL